MGFPRDKEAVFSLATIKEPENIIFVVIFQMASPACKDFFFSLPSLFFLRVRTDPLGSCLSSPPEH